MSVYEFCNMCTDSGMLYVEIWDNEEATIIYQGPCDELPMELEDEEISSFDVPTRVDWITLNIH